MLKTHTRMTRQRTVILETLRATCTHPTADEMYSLVKKRLPNISLGTVYRNLDFLAANNDILKLEAGGSTRRFDGMTKPHSHIRCIRCGRVADVQGTIPIPNTDSVMAEGFDVLSARVEYDGLCVMCTANAEQQL